MKPQQWKHYPSGFQAIVSEKALGCGRAILEAAVKEGAG